MNDKQYLNNCRKALRDNPVVFYPRYADDPVGTWRYVIRGIAAGLTTRQEVGTLYGIIAETCIRYGFKMPEIDNRHVMAWISDLVSDR